MRIHAISLAKNEPDVIGSCLDEAARWCDRIYAYDGGSTDGTWERVEEQAGPAVVPWRRKEETFREGLRAEVFAAFRARPRREIGGACSTPTSSTSMTRGTSSPPYRSVTTSSGPRTRSTT